MAQHPEASGAFIVCPCSHESWSASPDGGTMGDDQALKRQFLVRAKALSEQPEVFRCVAVKQLIGDTVAFGVRAEAEIFQAVYGDPGGRKYWEAHLSEAIPAAKLAHLLAVHLAESAERLSVWKSAILLAIRDAVEAGERWFIGGAAPQLIVEYDRTNFEDIYKVKVHPRPAVEWLLSKPKREHLVPRISSPTSEIQPATYDH